MTDRLVPTRLLVAGEVAVLLGLPSGRAFLARVRRMRGHGFPASVPGCGRRWDRDAILAWLDGQIPGHVPPGLTTQAEQTLIRRARALAETDT